MDESISKLRIRMSIPEAEARVWSPHGDYLEVLRRTRYNEVPENRLYLAIQHILGKLKPPYLM